MATRSLVPPGDWLAEDHSETSSLGGGFLLAVTLLAAFLRLYHLGHASLWVDEILTWNMIRPDRGFDYLGQVWEAIQGPLYLLVVWPLMRIQENEWMMRVPAAVAGILTVPLFGHFLGRVVDHRAARLGTLLLAISPFHVWYSQEGRGYAFLVFSVVLLAIIYEIMTRKGPSSWGAVAFALAGAASILSNMSGLFLLVGMGLCILLFHRPDSRRGWILWAVALGGAVLLSLPWILKASGIWAVDRILPGSDTGLALRGQTTFSPLAIPYSMFTFFFGHSFGPSLRELHQPDRLAVLKIYLPWLVAAAVPVGLGLLSALRHLGARRLFLLVFVLVPMLILVVLAVRNIKPWNPRYVSVVFPFLLVLLALGLTRLPGLWGRGMVLFMVLLSFWSLSGYYWNDRYAKADVRGAVTWVEKNNLQEIPVLVPVVTGVYSFYAQSAAPIIDAYHLDPLLSDALAQEFYSRKLSHLGSVWFVSGREWYFDPQGRLPVILSKAGALKLEKTLPGVRIYHWENQNQGGDADGN